MMCESWCLTIFNNYSQGNTQQDNMFNYLYLIEFAEPYIVRMTLLSILTTTSAVPALFQLCRNIISQLYPRLCSEEQPHNHKVPALGLDTNT